ncbi:MAG: ABC transporter permease [Candidatus Thorarchaeota archaeon SMTZ1-45]|nr:MAG: peptide ABC transporter permease [Candidatus Thorarchaeota archaeon SMTZ1-45]
MKLRDFILRRILLAIPVIFGVLTITWFLAYVIGDPVSIYINENTPVGAIPAIRAAHGFDEPLHIQYFLYISSLLQGDWGISPSSSFRPVLEVLSVKFPATIELSIVAMIIAIILGIPLGIISATRKDQKIDHFTRVFSLAGVSMPIFWFALMLKYVFFYQFTIAGPPLSLIALPGGERYNFTTFGSFDYITGFLLIDSLLVGNIRLFVDAVLHLVMPGFCLGYLTLAIITRMMRSSMLEVLKEDYITLARSKGLTERIVIYRHALRNALIPTVTVIGLAFGSLITGAVLTETIFNWPGLGRWAVRAIFWSDIAAITGFTLLVALVFVSANLIVDLIYGVLDPRIRFG